MFKKKEKYEYEFLPAALEIEETPPSPLGKFVIWMIFLIIIIAVSWSILAETDKIAVARGKIVPVGKSKVIEPFADGVVKNVYVKEGQKVKKGQLLISLDSTIAAANVDELEKYLAILKLEEFLLKKQLTDIKPETVDELSRTSEFKSLTKAEIDYHLELQSTRYTEFKEKELMQNHIIMQNEAELSIAKTILKKLNKKYKVIDKQTDMYKKLSAKGSISKQKWIDKNSELETLFHDIKAQTIDLTKIDYQILESKRMLSLIYKQWRTENLREIVETEKKIRSARTELIRASRKLKLHNLYSPVDGIINQLEVTTIGETVIPGQSIITIIPENMPKLAEVQLPNKDIGFVHIGQKVELKLDTFPFHKYGVIEGKVIHISPDAIVDQKTGNLTYELFIKPDKNRIRVNDHYVNLTPGMMLTAEIKTGRRRIIDYFLDPIMKFKGKAFKER